MKPTETLTASTSPVHWEPARAFLKFAIALILIGSAAFLTGLYLFLPDQTLRAGGPLLMSAVALAAWYELYRGRLKLAAQVLAYGFWMAATLVAYFTGGVTGMAIIVYPQIILFLGWMVGTRSAIAMTLLTIATTLGFVLAEWSGVLPPIPPTPPALRWMIQSLTFLSAAVLVIHFVRAYQSRLVELSVLDRDLQHAQGVAHVGSWVYDVATDRLALSAETCRIFGLPEGTPGSRASYIARVHPADRGRIELAWDTAFRGDAPFDNEHRICVGEQVRWVRQRAEIEFGAGGRPVRSLGTTQDITAQRTMQDELLQQKTLLGTILKSASEAIFAKDLAGRYAFINDAGARMLGRSEADIIGRDDRELLPESMAAKFRESDVRVISSGESYVNDEYGNIAGAMRAFVAHKTPWRDHSGQIVGVIGISNDITQRKLAEDELRKTAAFSESLSEAMPLPVFHKDASGRYTGCNSAFARFIGKPREAIVGKTVYEVSPQTLAATYEDKDLALLEDPVGTQTYESHVAHADGSMRDVIFHKARLLDDAGRPIGIVGIITDITELKRFHAKQVSLESQLRESQKMEALGTLAGGVAHDFNNIVAAIIGNEALAREDVGPGHPAMESLEEIRKASARAKDLVQQILAFGRRQGLARKVIALAPVVQESVRLLRTAMLGTTTLKIEYGAPAPEILADPTQIQQVLMNLCNNARHAVEDQGRAGIVEIRLDAETNAGAHCATLTVRDNGHGMDDATRSRIFEPFFTTKPVGKGTGLGLAVVHSILKDHEASVEVRSAPGSGTSFVIRFPAARPAEPMVASGKPAGVAVHGAGRHVLYVDDDEAIVFLITRLLERQGYRVSSYVDARLALDAVRARPGDFDLVVTDYNMPGMSGLDVAHALKKIRADLPVALASGYITEELRQQAPAAGVSELIYKPNTVEDLVESVARLAQGSARV